MSIGVPNSIREVDAQAHFSELLAKVESGVEVTITKNGAPVAKVVPLKKQSSSQDRRAAVDRIKALSKGLTLGGAKIRDLINEGRR
jgi:prevent-host-death family protein